MSATARFKKDFGYYFLGIIVPGLLNAAMVPILKHLLGTENFGSYSLKFNFLLLFISTVFGGLCQGIIRFKVDEEEDLPSFYANVFLIAWRLLIPIVVISFIVLKFYFNQSYLLAVIYAMCLIGCVLQNIVIAISQACFQPKYIIFSESVRAFAFFLLAIGFLLFIKTNNEALLFLALLISYLISSYLLVKKNKISWHSVFGISTHITRDKIYNIKSILMYGMPLVLWYSVFSLLLYLDKPLIAKSFGLTVQGNYQALYDMIFRGITFLMAPISTAIFPILNQSVKEDIIKDGYLLLKKIFIIEMVILVISLLIYWYFGFLFLANLLLIPNLIIYKLSGAIIICFTILWQMAMIAHKPLEIAKRTDIMFLFIFISFLTYLISFFSLKYVFNNSLLAYTIPCVIAAVIYNIECLIFYLKKSNIKISGYKTV